MLTRTRRVTPALADASRRDLRDDLEHQARMFARSLRQMVRAGLRYAMVPVELEPVDAGWIIAHLDPPLICGVILRGHPDRGGVDWVCLAPYDPGHTADGHAWPDDAERLAAAGALAEQTDPVARIERRALMALEGVDAFPHLTDMPPA